MKIIDFILFDPEKLFTSVLPGLTLLPSYSNYAQAMLSFISEKKLSQKRSSKLAKSF